ncbi:MAG: NitT/TauT family transport system ATP-binding protein [Verrucomicrobiales bacterium]|jgi:NitT/TauT family transport system ATP-binding protein
MNPPIGKTFVGRGRSMVALESISMTVESGEFLSFLDPSGCGKSALLNIIGGLEPATEELLTLAWCFSITRSFPG